MAHETPLDTFNRVIDEVLKHPAGPKRWRAAHDLLWLNLSPRNKEIYKQVVAENKLTREMVDKHGRAVGITKAEQADKTFRNAFSIPHGAYYAISRADPEFMQKKSNAARFLKAFPEYRTREVI